jgi:hypothetical protein
MSSTRLLVLTIATTLLVEMRTQSNWLRWLDAQYEITRRGFVWGLQQTGSASRRGIPTTRPAAVRETSSPPTVPQKNSLRATSQYFNVSRIVGFVVFWIVTSCGPVGGHQLFKVIYCRHFLKSTPGRRRRTTSPKRCIHLQDHTTSQPTRLQSTFPLPLEIQTTETV